MQNLVSRRLLRIKHAAAYLGISCKAVRQLINSGRLPYVQLKPANSPFLVDVRDLDDLIESWKVSVLSETDLLAG